MERVRDVYMCELDCHWTDVGSYEALAETIGTSDHDDNITVSETMCEWIDSAHNIALSESADHLIAAIGVENLLIVHTDDATLICHREEAERLKDLIRQMQENNHEHFI